MERTSTEQINKEIEILNSTKNQLDLTDVNIEQPTREYTFFSQVTIIFIKRKSERVNDSEFLEERRKNNIKLEKHLIKCIPYIAMFLGLSLIEKQLLTLLLNYL